MAIQTPLCCNSLGNGGLPGECLARAVCDSRAGSIHEASHCQCTIMRCSRRPDSKHAGVM
eukprot:1160849-Pyramimonas_sp.AAC.1